MRPLETMKELVQIRFRRTEKHRFVEIARQRGVTLSDLVRESLDFAARDTAAGR